MLLNSSTSPPAPPPQAPEAFLAPDNAVFCFFLEPDHSIFFLDPRHNSHLTLHPATFFLPERPVFQIHLFFVSSGVPAVLSLSAAAVGSVLCFVLCIQRCRLLPVFVNSTLLCCASWHAVHMHPFRLHLSLPRSRQRGPASLVTVPDSARCAPQDITPQGDTEAFLQSALSAPAAVASSPAAARTGAA